MGILYYIWYMKENIQKAIKHFQENFLSVKEVAELYKIDRKTLSRHLKEQGLCTRQFSKEKVTRLCSKIHKDKYDYSLLPENIVVREKYPIICSIHGTFYQDIYNHKKGRGCNKCARTEVGRLNSSCTETFITKSSMIHKNIYDYSAVVYKKNRTKVDITCSVHGVFSQTPDKHLQGEGCPTCAEESKGWSRSDWRNLFKPGDIATLYVLLCTSEEESFVKIGRTKHSISKRYSSRKTLPYKYKIVQEIVSTDPDYIYDLELRSKKVFYKYKYTPTKYFAGYTECYKEDVLKELFTLE